MQLVFSGILTLDVNFLLQNPGDRIYMHASIFNTIAVRVRVCVCVCVLFAVQTNKKREQNGLISSSTIATATPRFVVGVAGAVFVVMFDER